MNDTADEFVLVCLLGACCLAWSTHQLAAAAMQCPCPQRQSAHQWFVSLAGCPTLSLLLLLMLMLLMLLPPDDLSRQVLQAQAEDLAVEDCLLVLEKALLQGKLTPEAYMKQVGLNCFVAVCLCIFVYVCDFQRKSKLHYFYSKNFNGKNEQKI